MESLGSVGVEEPCLDVPSCPQAGSISFLAFHRGLLSPTVPLLGNTSRTWAVGRRVKSVAVLSHCSGSVLVSPGCLGESQTHTQELHQLQRVPFAPLTAQQGWTRKKWWQFSRSSTAIAMAAPTPVPRTAHLLLSQQCIKPLSLRARPQGGVLLKTSFMTATQKCQCLCGSDKSLLAIKTVTRCKQQKL